MTNMMMKKALYSPRSTLTFTKRKVNLKVVGSSYDLRHIQRFAIAIECIFSKSYRQRSQYLHSHLFVPLQLGDIRGNFYFFRRLIHFPKIVKPSFSHDTFLFHRSYNYILRYYYSVRHQLQIAIVLLLLNMLSNLRNRNLPHSITLHFNDDNTFDLSPYFLLFNSHA